MWDQLISRANNDRLYLLMPLGKIIVSPLAIQIIGLLVLLQIKHMFADFFLQTPAMLSNRSAFVHFGRALHCLIHAGMTALCLLAMGTGVGLLLGLCLAEWLVHYLIDWAKGAWSERTGYGPDHAGFWRAFGVDQAAHQLSYLAMVAVWLCA